MTMTKGERTELKQAVRLQFKVLRHEVDQRGKELLVEVEDEIEGEYDKLSDVEESALNNVAALIDKCNDDIHALLISKDLRVPEAFERKYVALALRLRFAEPKRSNMRYRAAASIAAKVKEGHTALDRQEADMLRKLTLDALEGAEARAFFEAIPTVSQLVPTTRLSEIEAALGDGFTL